METLTVTITDAVKATGVSRSRLYELMGRGEIIWIKVGRRRLIPCESLRAFVERYILSTSA